MTDNRTILEALTKLEAKLYAPALVLSGLSEPLRVLVQWVRLADERMRLLESIHARELETMRTLAEQRAAIERATGDA